MHNELPTALPLAEPDFEDAFIDRLYKLLHVTRGSEQQGKQYPGRMPVHQTHFAQHVRGQVTIAFNVIHKRRKANFIAFDIDSDFDTRLDILSNVLERMGLSKATFATNGSKPGKGKVIITLSRPMPRVQADKLRDEMIEKAGLAGLQCTKENKVDVFPTSGEGGLLRILGRNKHRNGPVETPLNLRGE